MIERIYQFIRQLIKQQNKRARIAKSLGKIDPIAMEEISEQYRNKGYKIGAGVRLIGDLDGINPHLISIGNYSVIGKHSALLAHCPVKGPRACTVGNYVYLGWGVIVLPGVTIGDFSIIGAGSVVTKDIPAGSIAAGNPAKVLRPATEAEKAHLRKTMESHRLFGWDQKESL